MGFQAILANTEKETKSDLVLRPRTEDSCSGAARKTQQNREDKTDIWGPYFRDEHRTTRRGVKSGPRVPARGRDSGPNRFSVAQLGVLSLFLFIFLFSYLSHFLFI